MLIDPVPARPRSAVKALLGSVASGGFAWTASRIRPGRSPFARAIGSSATTSPPWSPWTTSTNGSEDTPRVTSREANPPSAVFNATQS